MNTSKSKWRFADEQDKPLNLCRFRCNVNILEFCGLITFHLFSDTLPYGSGVSLILGNTMESVLSFDIKFTTNASITVILDTTEKGKQYYIHYTTDK